MEFECKICKRKFKRKKSLSSHTGWHKRYQSTFDAQIGDQLEKLKNLNGVKKSKQVKFKIGEKLTKLTARPCKPDGNCLFEALWFQTTAEDGKYNKKDVEEFKNSVLDTINDDDEYYRPFIENHLAETMNHNAYEKRYVSSDEAKKKRLRDKLMEKIRAGDEWGSVETIVAVQDIYNVNCVIFNSKGDFRMAHFEKHNDGTVLVTYQGNNHYDTVVNIKVDDVAEISKVLASRALN